MIPSFIDIVPCRRICMRRRKEIDWRSDDLMMIEEEDDDDG